MEAELVQLAREAVVALQGPSWVGIIQLFLSGVGLAFIGWGLFSMKAAGHRRDREIDELAAAFREQGAALQDQGAVLRESAQALAELLRRAT